MTQKIGETLYVGDDIRVVIVGIQGNRIRVGVDAPKDVIIDREKVRVDKETKRIDKSRRKSV